VELCKHTRRDFLRLTGLSAAGVVVAACAGAPEVAQAPATAAPASATAVPTTAAAPTAAPVEPTAVPEPTSKFGESPMLAEMVAAGDLPPVDERLPQEPLIVDVVEEIGQYGGTLTVGDLTANLFGGDASMAMSRPNLLRISHDITSATPNVLKDWELADDFLSVTCYLREGMKWSDGEPLTTEDIRFFYEDHLLNTEITPRLPVWFRPNNEPMGLDIIDDYTYRLTFAQPHPRFVLICMAHREGWGDHGTFVPSHYMKQFHIKYNDQANKLATDAGFDFWYQLYGRENNRSQSIDRPRVDVYMPVRDTPQMTFLERNPYYFAVDPEGNQLPYIDKIQMDRVADLSILDAKVVGGSYDFAAFQLRILSYSTYAEGAAASDARMLLWQSGKGGEVVYNVNMNWPDEEMRTVFQDDRFRQALSLAVNRADINNVIYFGNASETQFTVIPTSRHYKPEYAAAYAEYDLDRANALLDEMGLTWNAAKTHRQWPVSKKDMVIAWELVETETPKGPITELITEYWQAVGVDIQWKSVTRTLLTQKILANEEPMSLWHGDETADTLFLRRPKFFAPGDYDESTWAPLWASWWNSVGETGEEPPQMIKDLFDWHTEYNLTDSDEPARKVLESQAEHCWTIGAIGNAPHPLFVRNNLRNVSETGGFWTWDSLWTYPEFPEQWFIKQD
jgi:peptide/nickel transport system substrate-binding protein